MEQLLPLLPILACPIGMGIMMWFMMRNNKKTDADQTQQSGAETQDEIARLRAEVTLLRQDMREKQQSQRRAGEDASRITP